MMKHFKYIIALAAILMGLPLQAQKPAIVERDPDKARITENDIPYSWRDNDYYVSGTYYDTVYVEDNNIPDTAFTLILMVKEYFRQPQEVVKLYTTTPTYEWRGKTWPVVIGAVYEDTIHVEEWMEADTIYSLKMEQKPYYMIATKNAVLCQTEVPYLWRNKKYSETGLYGDTIKGESPEAKDTVYLLNLYVGVPTEQMVSFQLCPGEKVTYRGKTYDKEGIDTIRLQSISGCDSVYFVHVKVGAHTLITNEQTICEGDAYIWTKSTGETILTKQGFYYDSLRSVDGCDSVVCLHLTVNRPYFHKDTLTLCPEDLPYKFGTYTIDKSGIYCDTVARGMNLCDSIQCLAVTVLQDQFEEKTITFCSTEGTRHNNGELFFDDRVYIDTLRTTDKGCRRIVKTVYQAGQRYFYEESKHRLADSVNFVWRGQVYTQDGTYTQQKPGTIGCDSTWVLHLMTDYTVFIDSTFCDGQSLYYKNRYIDQPCRITDSLKTHFGGDSVVIINFNFKDRYEHIEYHTMCTNEPEPWPGHEHITFVGEGVYNDPYVSVEGCDSIFTAYVTESKPFIHDTTVFISRYHQKDSLPYFWVDKHGVLHQDLNSNVDIYDTLGTTINGCDSLEAFHLRITEIWTFDTLHLCPNGSVVVNGQRYSEPGDYEHWLTRSPESTYRDSILYFHIDSVKLHFNDVWDTATICQSEIPYQWHHRKCMTSGRYQDTIVATTGCDSIVYLRLRVNPTYLVPLNYNICAGHTAEYKGKQFPKGVYYDTLTCVVTGCDSVIQLNVNEVPTFFFSDTVYFNEGSSYIWRNHYGRDVVLTEGGLYYDSCRTVDGCDSIYRLYLKEKQTYHFYTDTAICANERPFRWRNNRVMYESGIYYDSIFTKQGVDSIYELSLTINPVYSFDSTIVRCGGDSITFGGTVFTKSGIYRDTLVTEHGGCDSVIIYHINFVQSLTEAKTEHLGNKGSIEWHGEWLSQPGYYEKSVQGQYGCDSIVYKLTLVGDSTYHFHDTVTICSNERYMWQGVEHQHSGYYEWKGKSIYGMDSIESLQLYVNPIKRDTNNINRCFGQSIYLNKQVITRSGNYNDTLRTYLGCDSITTTIARFYPTYLFPSDTIYLVNGSSVVWHDTTLTSSGFYTKHYTTHACQCDSDYQVMVIMTDTFSITESAIVCQGDLPYYWQGRALTESGRYTQIYPNQHGADSVYHLNLTVARMYRDTSYTSICPGGKIAFFNQTITQPGVYSDTLLTMYGCDSIFVLNVNQSEQKISYDTIQLCQGQKFPIRDTVFTTSGIYEDVILTHEGCDSIVRYIIQITPTFLFDEERAIGPGESYIWTGHKGDIKLTTTGVYFDSLTTVNGCDSVYRLTLKINPTHYYEETVSICKNETPYLWHNKELYTTGTYYDSLKTKAGKDSIYCIILTVNKAIVSYDEYTACYGDVVNLFGKDYTSSAVHYDTVYSYNCPQVTCTSINFYPRYDKKQTYILSGEEPCVFFDSIITTPGIYFHKGQTIHGCDSTVTLTVTKCVPTSPTIVRIQLCSGDSIMLGDTAITKGGTYTRTYPSLYGCDSVVQYIVNEKQTFHFYTYAEFCENESYQWIGHYNDTILRKPGRYDEIFKTVSGCDSIYTLQLHATKTYAKDTTIYRCKGEIPYYVKGKPYWEDHEFVDSMKSVLGCDSVFITRYILNEHCSDFDLYTRCQGDQLIIDHKNIITDGEYRIPVYGDSIHRFNVVSYPVYNNYINLGTHCDSVEYQGETYLALGLGNDTMKIDRHMHSVHGCDSTEHLTMVLYKSAPLLEHTQVVYDYESVLFGGQMYYASGDYVRNYHTTHGCDSTVILHLQVIPTDSTGALHYGYCSSETTSLEVFGKMYRPTQDTIIFDTVRIPDVDMKIIKKAIVRVTYPFTITSLKADNELCASQSISFDIVYKHNGSYPARYELDFLPNQLVVSPTHQEGSIYGKSTIHVDMSGRGLCVSPGYYPYQLKLISDGCHMSDTVITSSLTVHYPSSVLEAYWDNTIALVNQDYNDGQWKFLPPYNWQIFNASGADKTASINPNQNLSYISSDLLSAGDLVIVSPTREGYDREVSSCEYVFYPVASNKQVPILVYPTAVKKSSMVTIDSSVNGTYSIFNSTGQKLMSGTMTNGIQSISMPAVNGCYVLYLQPENAGKQVKKIIVY